MVETNSKTSIRELTADFNDWNNFQIIRVTGNDKKIKYYFSSMREKLHVGLH